jgi:hypothetical protein
MNDARAQSENGEGQREAVIVWHNEKTDVTCGLHLWSTLEPAMSLHSEESGRKMDEERHIRKCPDLENRTREAPRRDAGSPSWCASRPALPSLAPAIA